MLAFCGSSVRRDQESRHHGILEKKWNFPYFERTKHPIHPFFSVRFSKRTWNQSINFFLHSILTTFLSETFAPRLHYQDPALDLRTVFQGTGWTREFLLINNVSGAALCNSTDLDALLYLCNYWNASVWKHRSKPRHGLQQTRQLPVLYFGHFGSIQVSGDYISSQLALADCHCQSHM